MINILKLELRNGFIEDQYENRLLKCPYETDGAVMTKDVFMHIHTYFGEVARFVGVNRPYVVTNDSNDGESIIHTALVLGIHDQVNYKKIEQALVSNKSDVRIDPYSSKYATPNVLKEWSKPYGSTINIAKAKIVHGHIRHDERVFGLKYAKEGIHENLVYLDFKNFYPNLMEELGCPPRFNSSLWKELIADGNCKFTMNKLIGRFDADYSIFYNPEYVNSLRKFGRLKLLYWISKCDELIFSNTDSILARVSEDVEFPKDAKVEKIDKALIKNIGNYVFYVIDSEDTGHFKTAGIFNKPEELVIAKERLGYNPSDDEFLLSNLFGTDEDGYISSDSKPIEQATRRIRYGKSPRLFKKQLISIQENI